MFTDESFALFSKYQQAVHHESSTKGGYTRFLCDSAVSVCHPYFKLRFQKKEPVAGAGMPSCGFGSFHMEYRLDGKLIAVCLAGCYGVTC